MCFERLPVAFDDKGKAYLKDSAQNPYGYEVTPLAIHEDRLKELLARNGFIKSVDFDPVTRVAGALAFHSVVDLENRQVLSANSMATLFRGYEIVLQGRDPRDAIYISSRACGVCGGVHAAVSALAIEMAYGIKPPPMGIVVRNMLLAIEFLYDNPLHLFLLAGPDYSQALVEPTNPTLWARAQGSEAKRTELHGFATMGELMTALNPLTGSLYAESLHMTRVAREAYAFLGGKYPHPQTVVPGGMSTTVNLQVFNEVYSRLKGFFDYAKKTTAIWDDLTEFFFEADPKYREVGKRPMSMIDTGVWDDPDSYDTTYANCSDWGEKRWATPGVIIDGELKTSRFQDINIGLEEFVDHSYYEDGSSQRFPTDALGAPLSPYHPWNKETKPKPGPQSWKERYSWGTSPRWDRQVTEAGTHARVWTTAKADKVPHRRFIDPYGAGMRMLLPKSKLPEMVVDWKMPETLNAFERNRAQAYAIAHSVCVAMDNWLMGMELLKKGDTTVSTPFDLSAKGTHVGVGFWGAGRGYLTHHRVATDGQIDNYQILTPSTSSASPRDPFGQPGPYEEAVMNTPILEEFDKPEDYTGIDILRAIRSYDPCMPCTTHIMVPDHDMVITREVNSCGCEG
ncbi:nickel-dependent hydrogenase large subunit [soil metagenome]